MAKPKKDSSTRGSSKAEQAKEASGSPVPAGVQVSPNAGPGRVTHDVMGQPVPEDEQLLESGQDDDGDYED